MPSEPFDGSVPVTGANDSIHWRVSTDFQRWCRIRWYSWGGIDGKAVTQGAVTLQPIPDCGPAGAVAYAPQL